MKIQDKQFAVLSDIRSSVHSVPLLSLYKNYYTFRL